MREKENLNMKKIIIMTAIGITGYTVGVLRMKYAILKAFFNRVLDEIESE